MDRLPDELLVDVLRHLPPRGAASCRAVCKGWCAAVDDGGMLLAAARLVPRLMRGFFVNYAGYSPPYFYSRGPTVSPSINVDDSVLHFTRDVGCPETVLDHRNGLLLMHRHNDCKMHVCNPATRRWAELPTPPFRWGVAYLVFDPVTSLHYDVLLFQKTTWHKNKVKTGVRVEWPPYAYMVQVYSSRTDKWEEWPFLREGDATTTTMWTNREEDRKRHAVYWRGALYLHCRSGLIIRFSLEKRTYLVIGPPEIETMRDITHRYRSPQVYLGKSEHGVYYTMINECQLRAWVLLESSKSRPTPKWVLKHHSDLLAPFGIRQRQEGEKTVVPSCFVDRGKEGVPNDRGDCEWEFADDLSDDISEEKEEDELNECRRSYFVHRRVDLIGYHPYKEIAFLGIGYDNGYAYYMGTSKLRHLGPLYPMHYDFHVPTIRESFIYTPCENDLLPTLDESDVHSSDG